MGTELEQEKKQLPAPAKKKSKAGKVASAIGLCLLVLVFAVLLINAALSLFMPHYYPTFGGKRFFAIVSDSMEPEIPTGSLITTEKPQSEADIEVGTVITFEVVNAKGKVIEVLTHRVVAIGTGDDAGSYITKGDNAKGQDAYHPKYENVVGIYKGQKVGVWGYVIGFLQSAIGVIAIIIILFIIFMVRMFFSYAEKREEQDKLVTDALKKSAEQLSGVNLRYDNIREITAVMDVLGMVTDEDDSRKARTERDKRLRDFINAESIELPQTPETAAILDSLPAPDTPLTLASALRSGATLRQAEDGQTLILTGISGGKSILLTPVQTPDGIILCQQGVRIRTDLAPNLEDVGETSMPGYPEFFEGMPLKKTVEYPELPQPKSPVGVDMLSPHNSYIGKDNAGVLSTPQAIGGASIAEGLNAPEMRKALPEHSEKTEPAAAEKAEPTVIKPKPTPVKSDFGDESRALLKALEEISEPKTEKADTQDESRRAFAKYREQAAQNELKQIRQLSELLDSVTPIAPEDAERIAEYKKANKTKKKQSAKSKATPEQLAARKQRAEARKKEQEAFLQSLTDEDREVYLTEQKLSKSRAATIRRLKRIEKDRKILEKINSREGT